MDDDRRHPRRRRPSVCRCLVARQSRARLRAHIRQSGQRHPDRHRWRRAGGAAGRFRRRAGHPARAPRGDRVGPQSRPDRALRDLENEEGSCHVRNQAIRTEVHADRRAHRRVPGAHAARATRPGPRSGDRGVARVRGHPRRRLHRAVGGVASRRSPTSPPRRCSIRSPTRSIYASRSTTCGPSVCSQPSTRQVSRSPTSATSTTCCTRMRRFAARSTTSWSASWTPRRCSACRR